MQIEWLTRAKGPCCGPRREFSGEVVAAAAGFNACARSGCAWQRRCEVVGVKVRGGRARCIWSQGTEGGSGLTPFPSPVAQDGWA